MYLLYTLFQVIFWLLMVMFSYLVFLLALPFSFPIIQMRSLTVYVFVCFYIDVKEDMNLNEDRKAPLREKDLSTKREMVVQYISATAKSVSVLQLKCVFAL